MPPGKDTFAEVSERYLAHQRHRLTAKEYERQELILENHRKPFFPGKIAEIRRVAGLGAGDTTDRPFSACSPEQVTVAFRRACRKAGVADFHFHDLRHAAASWLRMAGVDIHTVAQILGHEDLRMAARYQHLSPAFMAEAVGRLDPLFGIESPPEVPQLQEAFQAEAVSLAG